MSATQEISDGEKAFRKWNDSDKPEDCDYSSEQLFAAGYDKGAKDVAKIRALLSRCAEHMISGSDIAESPLPTLEEFREALQVKEAGK